MKPQDVLDRLLIEQSSEWVEKFKNGTADKAEFSRWLLHSPRNVRHFLMMTALDEELRHFDRDRRIPIQSVAESGAEVVPLKANSGVVPMNTRVGSYDYANALKPAPQPRKLARRSVTAIVGTVAAGLALVLFVAPGTLKGADWKEYKTPVGQSLSVVLDDGSVAQLNTHTRISVKMDEALRDVRLLEGEALFLVQGGDKRRFEVRTADVRMEVQGTQFNVYQREKEAVVTVVHGRVEVFPEIQQSGTGGVVVSTGQMTTVSKTGQIAPPAPADLETSMAWLNRKLIFVNATPLGKIADEFNRYNQAKIRIEGEGLAAQPRTGRFNVNEPESLMTILEQEPDIEVKRVGGNFIVREKTATVTVSR
jgi:transmembrane sensor